MVRREDDKGHGHYRRGPRAQDIADVALDVAWWTDWGSLGGRAGTEVADAASTASGAVAREAAGIVGRGGSAAVERAADGGGFSFGDLDLDDGPGVVLAVLVAAVAIVAAVVLLLPGVLFAAELLAFGAVVGGSIAWRSLTGRPWIIEAREDRPAPRAIVWEVVGWRASGATIDDVVADLQRGDRPDPTDTPAVEARVIDASRDPGSAGGASVSW